MNVHLILALAALGTLLGSIVAQWPVWIAILVICIALVVRAAKPAA